MIYLTFEANNTLPEATDRVRFDLTNKLMNHLGIYVMNGVTDNEELPTLQVINCENATNAVPVLKIRSGINLSMIDKNNCISLIANNELDLIALEEALLYRLLGVINV
jgi:hypothetical protein